jgi:hypothetical protein
MRHYRNFKEAKKFARQLDLTSHKEWVKYCKSNAKPLDIPYNPDREYKHKDWTNFGDWLGTNTVANKNRDFSPFEGAREFARTLGLKTVGEWAKYSKSGKLSLIELLKTDKTTIRGHFRWKTQLYIV